MTRLSEFASVVATMRQAQKEYQGMRQLRHTSQEWQAAIVKTRDAERNVDWWLKKLAEQPEGQPALFEE